MSTKTYKGRIKHPFEDLTVRARALRHTTWMERLFLKYIGDTVPSYVAQKEEQKGKEKKRSSLHLKMVGVIHPGPPIKPPPLIHRRHMDTADPVPFSKKCLDE